METDDDEFEMLGHNSKVGGIAADALESFISRIERLSEEKQAIQGDITDVYAQAKSQGFDPKIMRKLVAERKKDQQQLEEEKQVLDLYRAALGMI